VRIGIFICLCILVVGCTPGIKPIPISGVAELSEPVVQQYETEIRSIRLLSKMAVSSKQGHFTIRLAVVHKVPRKMRIELLPLNSTVSLGLLVSDRESATYVDFQAQRAIKGDLSKLLGHSFLKVAVNEAELISLLSGRLFRGALPPSGVKVYHDTKEGVYQFVSDRSIWVIDEKTKYFRRAQLAGDNKGNMQIEAQYLNDFSGHRVIISVAGSDDKLELVLDKIKIDNEIPDSLFSVKIPKSFTVY